MMYGKRSNNAESYRGQEIMESYHHPNPGETGHRKENYFFQPRHGISIIKLKDKINVKFTTFDIIICWLYKKGTDSHS